MKKLIFCNWKMNLLLKESEELLTSIVSINNNEKAKVVVAPSFPFLPKAYELVKNSTIGLSAQNVSTEEKGAFTGDVSAPMLKELGCDYSIIGHSEARAWHKETNHDVQKKASLLLKNGLTPVLCVGEALEDYKNGKVEEFLEKQIQESLPKEYNGQNIILAYEPIWSIGTGEVCSNPQIESVFHIVQNILKKYFSVEQYMLLYGGSVNDENIKELQKLSMLQGYLIGNASLNFSKLSSIISEVSV